jgi:hypothetical protein
VLTIGEPLRCKRFDACDSPTDTATVRLGIGPPHGEAHKGYFEWTRESAKR